MEEFCLEKFITEIKHLREAKELLEEIWVEVGPYSNKLNNETMIKLQKYFDFDDSE